MRVVSEDEVSEACLGMAFLEKGLETGSCFEEKI